MVQVSYNFYSPSLTAQCESIDIFKNLIVKASNGMRYLSNSTFGKRALGVIKNALSRHPGIAHNQKKCVNKACAATFDHGEVATKGLHPLVPISYRTDSSSVTTREVQWYTSCVKFAVAKALAHHSIENIGIGISCGYDDSLYQGLVCLGYYAAATPVVISSTSKAECKVYSGRE